MYSNITFVVMYFIIQLCDELHYLKLMQFITVNVTENN